MNENIKPPSSLKIVDIRQSKEGYWNIYEGTPEQIENLVQSEYPLTVLLVRNATNDQRARAFERASDLIQPNPDNPMIRVLKEGFMKQAQQLRNPSTGAS